MDIWRVLVSMATVPGAAAGTVGGGGTAAGTADVTPLHAPSAGGPRGPVGG